MVSSSGEMVTMEFPVAENLRLRAKARDSVRIISFGACWRPRRAPVAQGQEKPG